jgi:hypothetical protein
MVISPRRTAVVREHRPAAPLDVSRAAAKDAPATGDDVVSGRTAPATPLSPANCAPEPFLGWRGITAGADYSYAKPLDRVPFSRQEDNYLFRVGVRATW